MRILLLLASLLLAACATAPPSPQSVQSKAMTRSALSIDADYVATLKEALAFVRNPNTNPNLIQGVQNSVDDCSRTFNQLEKATSAALASPEDARLTGNVDDWIARAKRSLANLKAMMREKP